MTGFLCRQKTGCTHTASSGDPAPLLNLSDLAHTQLCDSEDHSIPASNPGLNSTSQKHSWRISYPYAIFLIESLPHVFLLPPTSFPACLPLISHPLWFTSHRVPSVLTVCTHGYRTTHWGKGSLLQDPHLKEKWFSLPPTAINCNHSSAGVDPC